ncbi:MAG TPA: hypothetical protein VI320_19845 [Terracidiphilus sp.]|jgi:hypothetical protein
MVTLAIEIGATFFCSAPLNPTWLRDNVAAMSHRNLYKTVYRVRSAKTPLEALRRKGELLGYQSAVAKELGTPRQHISNLLNGKRGIAESLANALGFKKLTVFEPIAREPFLACQCGRRPRGAGPNGPYAPYADRQKTMLRRLLQFQSRPMRRILPVSWYSPPLVAYGDWLQAVPSNARPKQKIGDNHDLWTQISHQEPSLGKEADMVAQSHGARST